MNTDRDPAPFIPPSLDELQPLFPAYRIEGFIAQGGRGALYRAYQTALDRPVAIKILPRDLEADESFRASFAAGAKAMARLNHPSVISVYDFGDIDGMLFLVREYVDGVSLEEWSAGTAVPPAKAVEIVAALCHGIAHAHDNGLVHGELNPANIFLDAKLHPRIGDFRLAGPQLEGAAGEGPVGPGTAGYAAPELAQGDVIDERTDVYALGALLHRLLTGHDPAAYPLPPVSELCDAPLVFDTLIARATAFDPAERFAGAEEFANNLEQGARVIMRPPTIRAAAPVPPPVAVPSRPAPLRVARKSSALPVTAMVVAGAVIGGVLFLATRDGEPAIQSSSDSERVVHADREPSAARTASDSTPQTVEPAASTTEPAAQALAGLKAKLAAGARDEFPPGTAEREGSHFLVLDQEMSWPQAREFAEAHGAHLAVLPSESDQSWFRETFAFARPLWLGAGTGAEDRWQWLDASPWSSEVKSADDSNAGRNIAFSATGGLFPSDSSEAYGLALQWRADGSNPATLEAQLTRTAASAQGRDASQILHPAGTRTLGDSHFLFLARSMTWDEARRLADSLGAYLAVPSTAEEHAWLIEAIAPSLGAGQTAWLGGFRLTPGDRWQWLSREAWNNCGWQPNQPLAGEKLSRLALHAPTEDESAGWVAGDGEDGVADGLLLEWGPPRAPATVAAFEVQPWLDGVNRNIASRVSSDLDGFAELKKGIVQDYSRSMNRILRREESEPAWGNRGRGRERDDEARDPRDFRRLGQSRRALEAIEEALKESSRNGELLAALPFGASEAFREQQEKSASDLKLLEDTYALKLADQLSFYRDGLRRKSTDLGEVGYLDHARELNSLAASIEENLPAFLKVLFGDSPRARLPWGPAEDPGIEEAPGEPAPNPFGPGMNRDPQPPEPENPGDEPEEPLFPGFEVEAD